MNVVNIKQILPADGSWYAQYDDVEIGTEDKVVLWGVAYIKEKEGAEEWEYPAVVGFVASDGGLIIAEETANFAGYIQQSKERRSK